MVAFEMAQQLVRKGEDVALLFFLTLILQALIFRIFPLD